MATKGERVLFICNDIPAEQADDFNDWYIREHLPERANGLPGFNRGRRYEAVGEATPRYLAFYEVDGPEALSSPEYLALVHAPDPRNRRPHPRLPERGPDHPAHGERGGRGRRRQPPLNQNLPLDINSMNLKDALRRIQTDRPDVRHAQPFLEMVSSTPPVCRRSGRMEGPSTTSPQRTTRRIPVKTHSMI